MSTIPAPRPPRPTVVVIGDMAGKGPPPLGRTADAVEVRFAGTRSELDHHLPGAEIALVWDFSTWLDPDWLRKADSLRWVHVAAAGVDAVLSPELAASDIVLTNARGVFDSSIAETVAGMVLVFAKDMLTTFELQQQRVWRHRETEMVAGQSAVVVGAGGIGRSIARLLVGLGMDVTLVASAERVDREFGAIRAVDDLDGLLPGADFVVIAAPLTESTRGLFGAARFRAMRASARLVNVGRGELVDEAALVAALRSGEIAGAALDVFHHEPLPADHPLWAMPQVLVSPHMSADFEGWLDALADQFLDNLERWLAGRPLANVVDKQRGYVPGSEPEGAAWTSTT